MPGSVSVLLRTCKAAAVLSRSKHCIAGTTCDISNKDVPDHVLSKFCAGKKNQCI
jgi:hypothetical protein